MTQGPPHDIDEQRAAAELRELDRRNAAELQALHEDVKELRSLRRQLWVALAMRFVIAALFLAGVAGIDALAGRPGVVGEVSGYAWVVILVVLCFLPVSRFRK